MTRRSTWEADLYAYIASVRDLPLMWGSHDCGLFFAGAVEAMTGFDPGAPFRGKYTTEMGAAKALAKFGEGDLQTTLDGLFDVIPVGFIQRGDGVWNGESVGISMGAYALFVATEGGLTRVPRTDWVKGWLVGNRADHT